LAAITGASSGIGAVFAQKLADRGYDLLLIARREERLRHMAGSLAGAHETLAADLATPEGIRLSASRLASDTRLALLVNNAGFGTKGRFFEAPFEEQARMHALHVQATLGLSHAALQGMVARDSGGIINVSSVAAFTRSPGNASYCATKAWMNAFTEGLYLDLKTIRSKVTVQALCPGFTYTEFHDVMGVDRGAIPAWLWMRAETVVDASLRGLDSGRLLVVPGAMNRLFASLIPRLPGPLRLRLELASPHSRKRLEQG
jgi:short-subunit dehydrogenase